MRDIRTLLLGRRRYNQRMERDEFDDVREQEREAERDLRDAPLRDCGWRELDDPRSPWHGIVPASADERDRDPGDLPRALEERAYKDPALLSRIRGLETEVWRTATAEQRLETLREAERQLASFQGREACRTYAVQLDEYVDGQMVRIAPEPTHSGSHCAWRGHAEGRYIQLSEEILRRDVPETVVVVFAHESFHAYQTSVLWASEQGKAALELLRRYPDVDAKKRSLDGTNR